MTAPVAPGPEGRHLMGALSSFKRDSLSLLTELQGYGGIARVRLGPYLVHQLTGPEFIKHVLQDNVDNYRRGRFYQGFNLFMGRGMLTTDGPEWRARRDVSQPFFQRSWLHGASGVITASVEELLERWGAAADRGEEVELVDDMMWLAMGVLSRMLFGVDLRERYAELAPAVRFSLKAMILTGEVSQMLPRWVPTRYRRELRRHQGVLNRVMDDVIALHRAGGGDPDDLVSALLSATDAETGRPWPDRQIRAELKTLFLAGHETTGCALAWTLYSVATHDEVRRKLETELGDVLGDRAPVPADLPRLPYLRQVVDESLRLHPPIWVFPRDLVEDDVIGGYHVPAGTTLLIPPYAAHRNPEVWKNPDEFDPERFCPAGPGPARYSYLPFGGGPRRCVGYAMALLELQFALAMIVRRFTLSLVPDQRVVPIGLVSLRPAGGIRLRLTRKRA
ncbi:cytochrome P450 [Nonomuraea sp. NPDC050310]|uniref:cytochrome P450 n=1 Tax=unclassified Nonomuraea TaxID=2593643 RepID=UPI0033F1CF83